MAFLLVYAVTLVVATGIDRLNIALNAPVWLRGVGAALGITVFIGDATGLLLLLLHETATLLRNLWRSWRDDDG